MEATDAEPVLAAVSALVANEDSIPRLERVWKRTLWKDCAISALLTGRAAMASNVDLEPSRLAKVDREPSAKLGRDRYMARRRKDLIRSTTSVPNNVLSLVNATGYERWSRIRCKVNPCRSTRQRTKCRGLAARSSRNQTTALEVLHAQAPANFPQESVEHSYNLSLGNGQYRSCSYLTLNQVLLSTCGACVLAAV